MLKPIILSLIDTTITACQLFLAVSKKDGILPKTENAVLKTVELLVVMRRMLLDADS